MRFRLALALAFFPIGATCLTPELQQAIRASTFEVVLKKPEKDPLSYEKPLPLELLPYIERTDAYQSIGTAFAIAPDTYVTAAHVFLAGVESQYGSPALRRTDGTIYPIDRILKFSAYQDFIVFSVVGGPKGGSLESNRDPKIDDPVLAVGNALGEGIVIRDGLYTSATPEEQDGRWKWIRFSAAASPGNSGGPLLDAQGRVVGIVIGKSPNENLNYSLPIAQVLDAPERKARFDQRQLVSLPYLHGGKTYAFKEEFDLPLAWPDFVRQYQSVVGHHDEAARASLLQAHADTMFPHGKGVESVLYAPEDNGFLPRVVEQRDDGSWSAVEPAYSPTELPGDGSVSVASEAGAILLRLVRPDKAADAGFFVDSRAFMDLALKGLNLKRQVGTDFVNITSMGPALADNPYLDHRGRKWQERIWAVPFLNMYVEALLLPTPDGYAGVIQYEPSANRAQGLARLRLLADLVDVSFTGTLAQWRAYLQRTAWIPTALADLRLEATPRWSLHTKRFDFSAPAALLALDDKSVLSLTMGFVPEAGQLAWEVEEAWWNRDARQRQRLGLWRRMRPPPGAKQDLRDAFDDMRTRNSPYDGSWSRDTDTTSLMSIVVDVPSAKAGLVSADLLYGLSYRTDKEDAPSGAVQLLQQVSSAVRVLESGPGEGIVPAQPLPATLAESFERLTRPLVDLARKNDSVFGKDLRGRLASEDLQSIVGSLRSNYLSPGANVEQLDKELATRTAAFMSYWGVVPSLMHSRDMWNTFLLRNRRAPGTPHDSSVAAAEAALMQALAKGEPNDDWTTLAEALMSAYKQERSQQVRPLPLSDADYRARVSSCPAPATATSGSDHPKLAATEHSAREFYPDQSRHLNEEGTVIVAVRVSEAGCGVALGVSGSSGSVQLDDAALRFAETFEFLPAEKDGKAIAAVKEFKVVFALKD